VVALGWGFLREIIVKWRLGYKIRKCIKGISLRGNADKGLSKRVENIN
jgi:hypothetical protein